jgi:hypothetical protein
MQQIFFLNFFTFQFFKRTELGAKKYCDDIWSRDLRRGSTLIQMSTYKTSKPMIEITLFTEIIFVDIFYDFIFMGFSIKNTLIKLALFVHSGIII